MLPANLNICKTCIVSIRFMLIKNGKITMIIQSILKELLECKFHEKCLCLLVSALFWNFEL